MKVFKLPPFLDDEKLTRMLYIDLKSALNETGESWLPVLPDDEDKKVASFDQSLLSITEPNSIESIITEPNPIKSMDTYLLCNKIRVYTGIPDKMLTRGNVVLPIGDSKWTIVSLGSA
ncbi:hypothetical protein L1987_56488 [Smallanthus sonchifolius]|uniref:Uncharacterized protein n=1 Tax=Smallanthus sonchifolius TaxID=185202 RepID=A0ACB9ED69_9ASTR|nr:hypothetical protein L1987_56488 [Smallanthus sonchifolius]